MRVKRTFVVPVSRAEIDKRRKDAIIDLSRMDIDFNLFRDITGYKGSPVQLLNDIKAAKAETVKKVAAYWLEMQELVMEFDEEDGADE